MTGNKPLSLAAILCAAAAICTPPTIAAVLSSQEHKIIAAAKSHHEENVAFLEKLVNVNSGTLNLPGVTKIADMLRPKFETLGLKVSWIPMTELGRAGDLVAEHRGGKGKRILLIAHLDTVFEPSSPFQTYVRKGNTAEGPGTSDIKGGVVVILGALQALKDAGRLSQINVTVFLSGDEEDPGKPLAIARRDLIAAGKASDVALDFEAMARQDGKDTIHIGRRGASTWKIVASASSGHSSGVGQEAGFGAVYELVRIIDEFRLQLAEPNLTYNASLIAGGTTAEMDALATRASASGKSNIIAAQAVAAGDIRALSDDQRVRVEGKMRDIVAHHLNRTDAAIEFEEGYPPMTPTPASQALFDQLSEISRELGLGSLVEGDPAGRGAGDIAFVAHDVPGLVGMGVAGAGAHAVGETADLSSLDPQVERAAVLIERLSR
jgi:glutamate carboxypeptidase